MAWTCSCGAGTKEKTTNKAMLAVAYHLAEQNYHRIYLADQMRNFTKSLN